MIRRIFSAFTFLAILPAAQALAFTSTSEQVLVSYNLTPRASGVVAVDPATGGTSAVWAPSGTGQNVGDIVYSPTTSAAYVVLNPSTSHSSIIKLSGTPQAGYTATTFLSNLDDVYALAVDSTGDLYFDQQDLQQNQQIWKADPQGHLTAVTTSGRPPGYFFDPKHMTVSPDGSSLYVTVSPANRVDVVALANGALSTIGSGNVGFPSGITFDGTGDLLVTRDFPSTPALTDIATLSLSGTATSYDYDSSWMPFADTGSWQGMEYDPYSGDIFVEKDWSLYAIDGNLQSTLIHQFGANDLVGLAVVPVPEPSTFALTSAVAAALVVCAKYRKRAH